MSDTAKVEADRRNAQTVRVIGIVMFAIGALLAGIGTTSVGLFVFYIALVFAGIGVGALGQSMYRKTLG